MNPKLLACMSIFLFILAGCSPKEAGTTASNTSTPAETPMKLTGEASYRERIAVPPTAQVEILLEDVSRADAPAEIIGSQTIPNAGQPPYTFSIEYLPSKLVANHRYNLRARLTVDGELMFTTDQSYPVFVDGQENQTNLLMRRVARHAPSTDAEQAHAFTMALSSVKSYQIQGDRLELLDENGTAIASFLAVALQ